MPSLFGGSSSGDNSSGLVGGLMEGLFGSFTPAAVAPRSLYGEGSNTLNAETALAPNIYSQEATYRPQYAALDRNLISSNLQPLMQSTNPQQTALLNEMNNQALSQLQMGATLDPSLAHEVQQSVRSGQAARGVGYGPSDVYQEAMQIGSAGQALRDSRRAFAGNVSQQNLATIQPYLGLVNNGLFTKSGPTMFDPWSPYASDLYNTNYNAENARNIAAAANRASVAGALLGAASKAATAGIF